jgi:hypothetical protein
MHVSQEARHLDYDKLFVHGMISAEGILLFIIALVPWTLVILLLAAATKKIVDVIKDKKEE